MEVFTIVANEVIGLSATECTLIQFSYNPEQIRDPETVLRSAVKDYLKTDIARKSSILMDTKTILSKRARILPNTNSATLISITRRKSMRWASISCF